MKHIAKHTAKTLPMLVGITLLIDLLNHESEWVVTLAVLSISVLGAMVMTIAEADAKKWAGE